jgi:hypothetical protein
MTLPDSMPIAQQEADRVIQLRSLTDRVVQAALSTIGPEFVTEIVGFC